MEKQSQGGEVDRRRRPGQGQRQRPARRADRPWLIAAVTGTGLRLALPISSWTPPAHVDRRPAFTGGNCRHGRHGCSTSWNRRRPRRRCWRWRVPDRAGAPPAAMGSSSRIGGAHVDPAGVVVPCPPPASVRRSGSCRYIPLRLGVKEQRRSRARLERGCHSG